MSLYRKESIRPQQVMDLVNRLVFGAIEKNILVVRKNVELVRAFFWDVLVKNVNICDNIFPLLLYVAIYFKC